MCKLTTKKATQIELGQNHCVIIFCFFLLYLLYTSLYSPYHCCLTQGADLWYCISRISMASIFIWILAEEELKTVGRKKKYLFLWFLLWKGYFRLYFSDDERLLHFPRLPKLHSSFSETPIR